MKTDKELAIELIEKEKGDTSIEYNRHFYESALQQLDRYSDKQVEKYLSDKASQILFSEGMAGKIIQYFDSINQLSPVTRDAEFYFAEWFESLNNNGTLDPRKIIEVYLQLDQPVKAE